MRAAPIAVLLAALAPAGAARGATELGPVSISGEARVGVRGVSGDDGAAKYEEYRAQEPGPFGSWRLHAEGESARYLRALSLDAGEGDQRHRIELGRHGRFGLVLELDDQPHTYSNRARTLYSTPSGGVLTLPAGLQASLEPLAPAAQSAALESALGSAVERGLDLRLRTSSVGAEYWLGPALRLQGSYRAIQREGTRPAGLGFGSPGGSFAVFGAPVDDVTRRARVGLSLAREAWSVDLTYAGSFYRNGLDAWTVANPLRATDSSGAGSSRGRVATAPDNDAHSGTLSGTLTLPLSFPARLAGTLAYELRRQTETFLPHTINGALAAPGLALPRGDLDGEVGVLALSLHGAARPSRALRLRARYSLYDHDSRTSALAFPAHVISDEGLDTSLRIASPSEHRRQNVDVEGTWRLGRRARLALGYAWEGWQRSKDRDVRHVREHSARAALRLRSSAGAQLRVAYRWSARRGSAHRPFAHLAEALAPGALAGASAIGQAPGLRKPDVADRVRNRIELQAQLASRVASLTFTAAFDDSRYGDTELGLTDERRLSVGADLGWAPRDGLRVAGYYSYEEVRHDLAGRFRPRRFFPPFGVVDDPLNDWSSDSIDRVHNGGISVELVLTDRLDARLAYAVQTAVGETRAGGPAGLVAAPPPTVSGDGGNAVSYPDLEDVLQTLAARLRYRLRDALRVQLEYRYERLDLRSYRTDPLQPFLGGSDVDGSGAVSPSTDVFLGRALGDYDVHVVELSFAYEF